MIFQDHCNHFVHSYFTHLIMQLNQVQVTTRQRHTQHGFKKDCTILQPTLNPLGQIFHSLTVEIRKSPILCLKVQAESTTRKSI